MSVVVAWSVKLAREVRMFWVILIVLFLLFLRAQWRRNPTKGFPAQIFAALIWAGAYTGLLFLVWSLVKFIFIPLIVVIALYAAYVAIFAKVKS